MHPSSKTKRFDDLFGYFSVVNRYACGCGGIAALVDGAEPALRAGVAAARSTDLWSKHRCAGAVSEPEDDPHRASPRCSADNRMSE